MWPKPEKQTDICRCEKLLNKIMTCHKEYTEILLAPPCPMKPAGFSNYWPEKPRLVSLWLGWTKSLPAICKPIWSHADTGVRVFDRCAFGW